ncbi:MAG: HypC/HybG/HupF family hydrogenase formation chaperone [Geobacteraceae bacterium]|nr:HypC/HybG/HupF family hydrogenase formation chaperone [Geobacteraceae bacterium]
MCLAVPMRITSIEGEVMVAEMDGVRREASLMMLGDEVKVGDYVLIHAGFAISRLDEEEAEETLSIMRDCLDLSRAPA